MFHELIIVGAGASGVTAAITAKDSGIDTALLEGGERICRKLLLTGNGRCNITNKNIDTEKYHSSHKNFFEYVLSNFTYKDTCDFFMSLGLPLVTLEQGKTYPMSLQASSVVDIFRMALNEREIPVYINSKVKSIKKIKNRFKISTNTETFESKKVILCTGGKSAPFTGSDGTGFKIAGSLNHEIITPIPSLVQLKLEYNHLRALSGIKFNGSCTLLVDGTPSRKEYGEILFTDYGISGPPVLQVSGIASRNLSLGKNVDLEVNMFPNMSENQFTEFMENHLGLMWHRNLSDALIGIINKKMIPILLKEAGIQNIHKPVSDTEWMEKQNIYSLMRSWTFKVYDTNSFKNSQVTSGGVDTSNVNPKTLESLITSNLYFAGELLDVDGDCGGFNLQWCWSSGFMAGKSAAKDKL